MRKKVCDDEGGKRKGTKFRKPVVRSGPNLALIEMVKYRTNWMSIIMATTRTRTRTNV